MLWYNLSGLTNNTNNYKADFKIKITRQNSVGYSVLTKIFNCH